MSRAPHPVSCTSVLLYDRAIDMEYGRGLPWQAKCTQLASRLHRLAKGAERLSVAECNGEFWECDDGSITGKNPANVAYWSGLHKRIDRAIAKLNIDLAPIAIEARRNGDPRGFAIILRSTDPTRPLPSNEQGGELGIA